MYSKDGDIVVNLLTSTEMASRHGVTLRTLRFYEEVGLIKPVRAGAQRLYSPRDSIRVKLILTGKRFGFSLRDIAELVRRHDATDSAQNQDLVVVLDVDTVAKQIASLEQRKERICQAIDELKARAPMAAAARDS